jgi:hypothetical protein
VSNSFRLELTPDTRRIHPKGILRKSSSHQKIHPLYQRKSFLRVLYLPTAIAKSVYLVRRNPSASTTRGSSFGNVTGALGLFRKAVADGREQYSFFALRALAPVARLQPVLARVELTEFSVISCGHSQSLETAP